MFIKCLKIKHDKAMHLVQAIPSTAILFMLFCNGPLVALCGNEVFASMEQLSMLRYKNTMLVNTIEDIIQNLHDPPHALRE